MTSDAEGGVGFGLEIAAQEYPSDVRDYHFNLTAGGSGFELEAYDVPVTRLIAYDDAVGVIATATDVIVGGADGTERRATVHLDFHAAH